jgi:hypothetical protein
VGELAARETKHAFADLDRRAAKQTDPLPRRRPAKKRIGHLNRTSGSGSLVAARLARA